MNRKSLIIIVLFFAIPQNAESSNIKYGFVNFDVIKDNNKWYKKRMEKLQKRKSRSLNQLQTLRLQFQNNLRRIQRNNKTDTPSRKHIRTIRQLKTLTRRIQRLNQTYNKTKKSLKKKFLQRTEMILESLSKKKNINVIYDSSKEYSHIRPYWIGQKLDFTDEVISKLATRNNES